MGTVAIVNRFKIFLLQTQSRSGYILTFSNISCYSAWLVGRWYGAGNSLILCISVPLSMLFRWLTHLQTPGSHPHILQWARMLPSPSLTRYPLHYCTRLSGGFCSTWITFPKILMKKVGIRIRIYLFFLYALLLNIKARSLSKCVGGKVNYLRYHKKRYRTGFSSSFFVTWLLITLFSRLCS